LQQAYTVSASVPVLPSFQFIFISPGPSHVGSQDTGWTVRK
jgi:hypothetical protein